MQIMIFTEGTITMHKSGVGHTREEIVQQAQNKVITTNYFADYVPIGNAINKIAAWKKQGAKILYLTSRKQSRQVDNVKQILNKYGFPEGQLLFRQKDEEYKNIAEKIMPDILIEDDCESIGGKKEWTITHIKPTAKKKIKSIIIEEFAGIDNLPDNISELLNY